MKAGPEKNRLLDDVLGADDAALRNSLLEESLRTAQLRLKRRQIRRALSAVAIVTLLALIWWRSTPPRSPVNLAGKRDYEIITSSPLPEVALITSQPLPATALVTSFASVKLVHTADSDGSPRELDDGQLLSLLGSTPAALIRNGGHAAQLVFVNADDEERFLRN